MIYPFSWLLYLTLEFCAGEHRLNNTRRHLHVSRRCSSVTPGIYLLCECVMSVIRWLVVQEVCSHLEFARHFESHLARPPPFYMRMQTRRLPMNIPLLLCYSVHVLYSQPIRLNGLMTFGPTQRGFFSYMCTAALVLIRASRKSLL